MGSVDQVWQGCLFSGGEFRPPAAGGTIGVRDKASGEIFGRAGLATQRRWLTVTAGPAHHPY